MRKIWLILAILAGFAGTLHAENFTGSFTTNWGVIQLKQDGQKVTGSYTVPAAGEIEGVVENGVLTYKWWQVNGVWGKGRFRLLENGRKIQGTWGHGISYDSGGNWDGQRH